MPKTEPLLDSIKCPGCGEAIPISETIYHQVAERAERELKAKSLRQERALADREKQLQAREEGFDRRESSGATGGLKHTADATFGMKIEAALQEFALKAGANSEHEIVILRIVVQCPVNGHREVIRLRKQNPKERVSWRCSLRNIGKQAIKQAARGGPGERRPLDQY
jgi:hypothetical protein